MSERGAASDLHENSAALGDQPTLAARPGQEPPAHSGARAAMGEAAIPEHGWSGRLVDGRYQILEQIGEGGMGVVYVAEHVHLRKRVAFKVIHPELAAHEELMLRFKREALATGQLDHPHIAAAIDFGVLEGGGAFMVMPLVPGPNLQVELDRTGPFDPRRAARLGAQIADALSAAHAVGIVHRDLKPDNVLIERRSDGSESAKVLDFGVASLAGRGDTQSVEARPLTQAGTILGTPGYMSPEQASAGDVDHRTDLYALGVILWELCRGERLFDGENITQIFAKQFKTLPPALDLGLSQSGRELSALVASLLAWDKNARPASAALVRDSLRRIAELPESRLSNLPVLGRLPITELKAKLAKHAPWLERVAPYGRLIAAGVAVLMVLAFFTFRRDKAKEPTLAPEAEPTLAPAAQEVRPASAPQERPKVEPPPDPHEAPREELAPERTTSPSDRAQARRQPTPAVFLKPAETLLHSSNRTARQSVAKRILRSTGVPTWLMSTAELELAQRCSEKKEWVEKMREDADPRVLPALERMADQPKHGCPPFRLADCLSCLRRDLETTIDELDRTP